MTRQKLSEEELGAVVGGTLYVSIDGGDKIYASVSCKNGAMVLTFQVDGKTVNYDTGVDLGSDSTTLEKLKYAALNFIDSQSVIDYTYNIDTDGKGL